MLTNDEEIILQMRLSESNMMMITMIVELFDTLNYVAHDDEFTHLIDDEFNTKEDLQNKIVNLFKFHLYRVGLILGLEFNLETSLVGRYFIIKSLISLSNVDKVILDLMQEFLTIDEDNITKLELILNDISSHDVNVYECVDLVTSDLIDNISGIITKDHKDMSDILHEITTNKLVEKYIQVVGKEPLRAISTYVKNNRTHSKIDILTVLFRDVLVDKDRDTLKNNILTLILLADSDVENYEELYISNIIPHVDDALLQHIESEIIATIVKFKQ